jgi:integrase
LDLHPLPLEEYLKQNLRETTVPSYLKRLKVLGKLGNLNEPNRMKTLICPYPVSEGRKTLLADAYNYYVQWKGLMWIKPKFVREDKPIFVPLEKELDQLIANAYEKMSVFLELLKECGMDSGEAWKLRWIDINAENKTVDIRPTKIIMLGHYRLAVTYWQDCLNFHMRTIAYLPVRTWINSGIDMKEYEMHFVKNLTIPDSRNSLSLF